MRNLNNHFRSPKQRNALKKIHEALSYPELEPMTDQDVRVAYNGKLCTKDSTSTWAALAAKDWMLAVEMEAATNFIAHLALVEIQSDNLVSSYVVVFRRLAENNLKAFKFEAMATEAPGAKDANEARHRRVLQARFPKVSTEVMACILLDPRTKSSAKRIAAIGDIPCKEEKAMYKNGIDFPEWLEVTQRQNPDIKIEDLPKDMSIDAHSGIHYALLAAAMSRSALTRHALQKSLRGQTTQDQPPEETQRRVKQDELPIYGNDTTYNLNTLLHQNILQSAYFHELYKLRTYHEVVDEIYYRVDHAEPWSPGTARIPSSCFCLLHKFFLMRLTRKQMQGLLRHTDSPYIRVVGFLYLRFTCNPEELWTWFEPYLEDPEEFNASANPSVKTAIGGWLVALLEENNYFGTILPRIPKKIEDGIKVKLLLLSRKKERAKENLAIVNRLKPSTKVRAMYADEENEPAMYDAVIDSVEESNQFWVSFPANVVDARPLVLAPLDDLAHVRVDVTETAIETAVETVIGAVAVVVTARGRVHDVDLAAGRDRLPLTDADVIMGVVVAVVTHGARLGSDIIGDLLQQVRERERRKAEAVGRVYASRPASYKGSLSLKLDRWTTRKRSRSPAKRAEVVVQPGMSKGEERARSNSPTPGKARESEGRLKKLREIHQSITRNGGAQRRFKRHVPFSVESSVSCTIRTVNELYGERMVKDAQHAQVIRAQSEAVGSVLGWFYCRWYSRYMESVEFNGLEHLWLRPKTTQQDGTKRLVVMYVHGGAFSLLSPRFYSFFGSSLGAAVERELAIRNCKTQVDIFLANYHNTPEFCFPKQPEDIVAAAGGGLVMSALHRLST
ncbi:hypothetical protein JG688_00006338 [Phytophthora aleatoria]|uniref:Pre-mRNA-splicing factor 38 n=1 Tax=Phytophthora aleatoria TaxID=2496075 RepID=A0A8J5IZN5_9STRA|nr:hypothetical protein JG688_00006338 [Phytophthora aleatoria]